MVTKVGLWEQASDPATVANKGYVYSKEVNSITELFYKDGNSNVTQLTLEGKVKGNTLNQSYDEGGAGVGKTITVDAGPVTLVAGGLEALHADGYIGIAERSGDPTLLANSGLVYTKEVTGVTELFYMNTEGVTTQLTDNGAVPGMNKIQEGNTVAEVHDTGSDGYFFVTTEGGERFRIGPAGGATFTPNINTNLNFNTSGTGLGVFANAVRIGTTTDTTAGNIRWTGTHFEGYMGTVWNQLDQTAANLTSSNASVITITDGTGAVMGTGTSISINKASAILDGYLGKDDFASFSSGAGITKGDVTEGTGSNVLSFSVDAADSVFGNGFTITVSKAAAGTDGYLTSADWNTFNNKEDALTTGDLTSVITGVITVSGGTDAVIGTGTSISINKASAGSDGYLTSTDWSTFNGKQDTVVTYDLSETASGILSITGGADSVLTNNVTIQVQKASAAQDGYLGKDDFATFSGSTHSPVTLNGSAVTGGLSLNVQELSFRAADATYDGYLKSSDWNTFNGKQDTITPYNLTESTSDVLVISGTGSVLASATIQVNKASAAQDGYLGKDDFANFAASGTLNQAYNYGGAGAGKTITVDSGAVTLTSSGGEALHTDGYIGIVEKASDPTAVANMGSVYTKDVNGITELFYFDSTGSYTQITDDGYLATANSLYQVGLYTKTWDPHANVGEGFIYTKWVDVETDKHSELYYMDDKAQVTQMTKDGSLNVVLTSPSGYSFELSVDDEGILSTKKI